MTRGKQLARALKMIKLLRERPRTMKELVRDTNTPLRTVYRDLEHITQADVVVYARRLGRTVKYWIEDW